MKTPANSLTAAIIKYIILTGGHAERVNNIARTVKNRLGNDVHIPSMNTKGTADIHACKLLFYHVKKNESILPHSTAKIGQFVAIEVKVGKDKQSEAQKYYQESVERAGGVYLIVHSFDEFERLWNEI